MFELQQMVQLITKLLILFPGKAHVKRLQPFPTDIQIPPYSTLITALCVTDVERVFEWECVPAVIGWEG